MIRAQIGTLWVEYELEGRYCRVRIPIKLVPMSEINRYKTTNPHLFLTPSLALFKHSTFAHDNIALKTVTPNFKLSPAVVSRILKFLVELGPHKRPKRKKPKARLIRYYLETKI